MGRLTHHKGKPSRKIWIAAIKQWVTVAAAYSAGWAATFVLGILVAITSKRQDTHPQGKPLTAYHRPDYVMAGSSGSWEYWNSNVNWLRDWNNYEDGTLSEPSGKGSARCGGKERSIWNQYLWTCRNPFNYGKRTRPMFHCLVDQCDIEYWGQYELSDKREDQQGWQFVIATDQTNSRKFYSYRKVKVTDDKKVRHTLFGFKVKPGHAEAIQDDDDKDKAFTIRIPVKQTID